MSLKAGTTDYGPVIQSAVDGCPEGQVVAISAGTYPVSSGVGIKKSGVVVRGAGPGQTVLQAGSDVAFSLGLSGDWPPPGGTSQTPVVSGATPGSTTVTVDSTAETSKHPAATVGGWVRIQAGKNPPWVNDIGVSDYDAHYSMTFHITAVTPTTVTFSPAIPFDFSAYSPEFTFNATPVLEKMGVEDMTIDMQGGSAGFAINLVQTYASWIKNVEVKDSAHHGVSLYNSLNGEIRHSYLHDSKTQGPGTEGLDFYRDNAMNLVEDNIIRNLGTGGIVLGDWEGGNFGNVIAYNYVYGSGSGDPSVAGYDIDISHGSNIHFNLLEGNIAGTTIADGYFGSTSQNTYLRNWITMTHPTATNNLFAVNLKHFSDFFNVVGNVLGNQGMPTTGTVDNGTGFAHGGFYDAPQKSNFDDGWSTGAQAVYELGFPNTGNSGFSGILQASNPIDYSSQSGSLSNAQDLDLNVAATLLRTGNYDYVNQKIMWDPKIASQTIPASLFRSSAPAYFGKLAWPPFDPASPPGAYNDTNVARIPAGYRFVNGVDP